MKLNIVSLTTLSQLSGGEEESMHLKAFKKLI